MQETFIIQRFGFKVTFYENKVKCQDLANEEILFVKRFEKEIVSVTQEHWNGFEVTDSLGTEYEVYIGLVRPFGSFRTEAGYILDLHVSSSTRGFYFGLYEIGEFKFNDQGQPYVVKSFPICYVNNGWATSADTIFLTLRDNQTPDGSPQYFFAKLNWNSPTPNIIWKKKIDTLAINFIIKNNKAFLALKNGTLEVRDIVNGVVIKKLALFSKGIATLDANFTENLIIGSRDGRVAAVSEDLKVVWNNSYSQETISAIYQDKNKIHFFDSGSRYFIVNDTNGEIINELPWKRETCSNLISFRDWFVVSCSFGLISKYKKDSFIINILNTDDLIRRVIPIRDGFLAGDDDGCVHYWKLCDYDISVVERS